MGVHPLALSRIRRHLASHQPTILAADRPHAAVALVLAATPDGAEVLFIVRAPHDDDPWSGNIAFPGGRVAPGDGRPRRTAERESAEELGIDLAGCDCLGRLDDLYGLSLPILVSCFVYAVPQRPCMTPNHEIASAFWYPLAELARPERHRLETFTWRGEPITQPVVALLPPGEPLLWGITYRLLRNFFAILALPFGETPRQTPQKA
jgi:8-oxo-dGTP pyrophosphatase MutT (NUDIX family)